ncbi:beta-defensin 116 [Sturnira hondurensis]|uniref:beta-defensin 116 n=1 Tax=Sturnira hondurensis TaxID=192404 RepID=UPI00187AE704|nr:beta-defensin 116 [Sturnira hondurensis]
MSVMKPYLMTISILLILVHKTPGGLLRSSFGKSQEPWNPCHLYRGMCRNTCRKEEVQHLTCPDKQKGCLKLPSKITSSDNVKKDSSLLVTDT